MTGLVMVALWRYMNTGYRLLSSDLSPQYIRRTSRISFVLPTTCLIFMGLVAVGVGQIINPLLLWYILNLFFIVLGVFEWRNSEPSEEVEPDCAPAEECTEDRDRADE